MRQDNVIAIAVFLAFIVYITLKGELRTYMGFFAPGNAAAHVVGKLPGTPGIDTQNAFAGIPKSWQEFFQLPSWSPPSWMTNPFCQGPGVTPGSGPYQGG